MLDRLMVLTLRICMVMVAFEALALQGPWVQTFIAAVLLASMAGIPNE